MKKQVVRTITKSIIAHVIADDIRTIVGAPRNSTVTFTVPLGGDYSGDTLDIGENERDEQIIVVTWKEEEKE